MNTSANIFKRVSYVRIFVFSFLSIIVGVVFAGFLMPRIIRFAMKSVRMIQFLQRCIFSHFFQKNYIVWLNVATSTDSRNSDTRYGEFAIQFLWFFSNFTIFTFFYADFFSLLKFHLPSILACIYGMLPIRKMSWAEQNLFYRKLALFTLSEFLFWHKK